MVSAMKRFTHLSLLSLFVCAALLLTAAHAVQAANGRSQTQLAMTFDDLSGDAIQSDGLGAYGARESKGTRVVRTGSRSLYFDFSSSLTWWSFGPFGYGVETGEIDSVTMTVTLIDNSSGIVEFEFSGLDPDVGDTTDFRLTMSVAVSISGDAWYLEASSEAELTYLYQNGGLRGNGHIYGPYWERAGIFEMPWGGVIEPQP